MAAEKTFPLSIIISTVDKATSGIRGIVDRTTKSLKSMNDQLGFRKLGESFEGLEKEAGLGRIASGFKGVAGEAMAVAGTLAAITIAAGLSVDRILHLVDSFAELNKMAKIIGVSVDTLAQLRFAAGQSGVSVEDLNSGMEKFNKNLGMLKLNKGPLESFLKEASPKFLAQLHAAKSGQEAFGLMAEAIKKVKDPTERAAISQAAFGKGGQALIPLLEKGSTVIDGLMKDYFGLAGSQEEAAKSGASIHEATERVSAAFDGIKAAIVVGLAPAFLQVSKALEDFVVKHREEIAAFIKDFGEKLPGRISALVDSFNSVLAVVTPVWNALGGLRTAAIILAAVITGKLILAIVSLGITLLTTPVGWIILALAALGAAAYALISNWDSVSAFFSDLWDRIKLSFSDTIDDIVKFLHDWTPVGLIMDNWAPISKFFTDLWDGVTLVFKAAWAAIKEIVDGIVSAVDTVTGAVKTVTDALGISGGNGPGAFSIDGPFDPATMDRAFGVGGPGQGRAVQGETKIVVDFANAPKGTRVSTAPGGSADVDLNVGYQMVF